MHACCWNISLALAQVLLEELHGDVPDLEVLEFFIKTI
jgi:hypothetical protein